MAVHITVFIKYETQVFPAILGLKPLRQLVSEPLVSGSVHLPREYDSPATMPYATMK